MPFPSSDMVRITCERCGFDGHYLREIGHQCRVFVALDEYESNKKEAQRYRWIRKNAVWRSSSDQAVTWNLYMPKPDIREGKLTDDSVATELDAAIDKAMADTPNATPSVSA